MIPQLVGRNRAQRREIIRQLERDNLKWPRTLTAVADDQCPPVPDGWLRPIAVMRSREFMCQVFDVGAGIVRLSINRTSVDEISLRWREDISWDELQRLKAEAGYGEREAVEIYPPAGEEVNVANMRHLWLLPDRMPFSWRGGEV